MNYAAEILTTYLECLIGYLVLFDIFMPKIKPYIPALLSLFNTGILIIINTISTFSYTALIATIIIDVIAVKIITKEKLLNITGICIVYYTLVHLLDFLTLSLWCLYYKNIDLAVTAATSQGTERIIFIMSIKTVTVIAYIILRNKIRKVRIDGKYIKFAIWFSFLVYIFDSFAVSSFLENSYEKLRVGIAVEWMWAILMFIFMIYAIGTFSKYEREKHEYGLIEIKNNMLLKNLDEIKNEYYRNAKNNHDFKHHLGLIEGYIANNNPQKATEYIHKLNNSYIKFRNAAYTHIEELDIILNYKIGQAEEKNIIVQCDCKINDIGNIDTQDFCIILSNALDNAIEANEKVEGNKYIYLRLVRNNNIIILTTENPAVNDFEGKMPKSTKIGKDHGWGLKSIKTAAKKYDGVTDVKCNNGTFVLTVTLFCNLTV